MRVSTSIAVLLVWAVTASQASSAPVEFPYEAVVKNDGIVVRSGPGERYDPTLKLNTGQQVTVHRHDPGGWYMISPPPGSFSWIDSMYVKKTGTETGIVNVPSSGDGLPPRVVVWIGSQFTDEHKYFGRQLASGDEVRILGQETKNTSNGPAEFYKIAPPRLEYRWVKGDFIVPLSEASRIAVSDPVTTPAIADSGQANPFASTSSSGPEFNNTLSAPGFPPEQSPSLLQRELTRSIDKKSSTADGLSSQPSANRDQLYTLDGQLKAMLAKTPDHWDLAGMEQAYRNLQATSPSIVAAQIESRLSAIESRKKVKAEFDAFLNLKRQTEERDAALLSMQQSLATGFPDGSPPVDLGQPTALPQQTNGGPASIPPVPAQPSQQQPVQASISQIDGAGIVRRLPRPQPGLPTHALVAPNGRHLAYLSAGQNIRLDEYVGKSMGVIGKRTHDQRLRSDVIVVEQLTPVQLQP